MTTTAPQKGLRLSINPTYDSRKTGPRYTIATFVADRFVDVKPLADPFVRHTVRVSILDAIRSILRRGSVVVSVTVSGHQSIVEDVMELDANYIGHGNTRRAEWTTNGSFIDYDGFGYAVKDGKADTNSHIKPSRASDISPDATHVVWFNR